MDVLLQPLYVSRPSTPFLRYSSSAYCFLRLHDGFSSQLAVVLAAVIRCPDSAICAVRHEARVLFQASQTHPTFSFVPVLLERCHGVQRISANLHYNI